jgi:two-component system, OmpR family, sensor histidine kinase KdpD
VRANLSDRREVKRHLAALGTSIALVGAVTGAVFAARTFAPVLSLGVLYLLAVVTVAVVFGLVYAIAVSIASMLAFNFFFLPPVHTFALRDSANWFALSVYLATAVVVSELAARSRRRATEAVEREREAKLLAGVAATLLEANHVQNRLKEVGEQVADALGLSYAHIEVGSLRKPDPGERTADLRVGHSYVGRLYFPAGEQLPGVAEERTLPALASILAVAVERERLSRAAVDAETLRRSDSIKTAVLRAVSHDLRSPLTAIRAAGEGLERADLSLDDRERSELVEMITGEAARLERLVTNLLDLSRLEAGAASPRPELWTADDLIGRALETVGPPAARVEVRLPDEPVAAVVDGAQAERVLVNLIENAAKFSSPDDPVDVEVSVERGELLMRIRDRGPGIPPNRAASIFDAFESSSRGTGMGLGLAIATGFAQANGGRVWFEPAEDGGAVFVFALPAARLPAKVRS